jgi:hypothetical protein
MKLCIADPPYLGRAAIWYGDGIGLSQLGSNNGGTANVTGFRPADHHPDAHLWDDPATHEALVARIVDEFDGWAIAMAHDNLRTYLHWVPADVRIGIWVKRIIPSGARVINTWEPVVVRVPEGRRASAGHTQFPRDAMVFRNKDGAFAGAKPPQWTRWVLDMLGYDPETDTVDDLFHGSGAVAAEIAQGVLL